MELKSKGEKMSKQKLKSKPKVVLSQVGILVAGIAPALVVAANPNPDQINEGLKNQVTKEKLEANLLRRFSMTKRADEEAKKRYKDSQVIKLKTIQGKIGGFLKPKVASAISADDLNAELLKQLDKNKGANDPVNDLTPKLRKRIAFSEKYLSEGKIRTIRFALTKWTVNAVERSISYQAKISAIKSSIKDGAREFSEIAIKTINEGKIENFAPINDKQVVTNHVQGLTANVLLAFVNSLKSVSTVTKSDILAIVRDAVVTGNTLTAGQKNLLTVESIAKLAPNSQAGALTVTIKGHGAVKQIMLSGFLATRNLKVPTKKPTAIVNYGNKPQASDLDPPELDGYTFTLKESGATAINNDGDSTITYWIFKAEKSSVEREEIKFKVGGFETKVQSETRARSELRTLTISKVTTPPSKQAKAMVNFGTKPQANDLSAPKLTGYTFTFNGATPVDENGAAAVTYEVRSNNDAIKETISLSFNVGGFETKVENGKRVAQAALNALTSDSDLITTKPAKARNVNYDAIPGKNDVTAPKHDLYTFTYKTATEVNDAGVARVTYDVVLKTDSTIRRTLSFNVSGFETKVVANKRKVVAALEDNKKLFEGFDQTLSSPLDPLPNGTVREETLEALEGHNAIPAVENDATPVKRTFSIATNRATGVAAVTVRISSGVSFDVVSYQVSGFKTTTMLNEEKVATDLKQFGDFSTIDDVASPAAQLAKGAAARDAFVALPGYPKPKLGEGVAIKNITIKTPLNTKTRKVVYEITLGAGAAVAKKTVTVTFMSASAATITKFVAALSNTDIDALESDTALASTIENNAVLDQIKSLSTFASLAPEQKALLKNADVAIAYDDIAGALTVTINNHGKVKTLQATGFKTGAKTLAEQVQALTNASLGGLDKRLLASAVQTNQVLAKLKAAANIANLPAPIKSLLTESNLVLKANDATGTLTVTISGHDKKRVLEMGGFKKPAAGGLSAGNIVGIVVGSIVGIGIFGYLIYYFLSSKQTKK